MKKYFSQKIFNSAKEALFDVKSGSRLLFGGFGVCGIPENMIKELTSRRDINNLEIVSNDCGVEDFGLGLLLKNKQIKKFIGSYVGENNNLGKQYFSGELELELIPQGTLAEKLRSAGAGIPAFFTPTGHGTLVEYGGFPIKLSNDGKTPIISSEKKEVREYNGKTYLLEESLKGDFSLIKGWKADHSGNIIFRKSARNFNPVCAKASNVCIAEVEEIVPDGALDPDGIHLQGIYVHRVFQGTFEKRIEKTKMQEFSTNQHKTEEVF